MATQEDLHALVDWLPECAWEEANETMLAQLKKHDPVRYAFFTAPEDDEPETEKERAAVQEAYDAVAGGERMIPDEELRGELGL